MKIKSFIKLFFILLVCFGRAIAQDTGNVRINTNNQKIALQPLDWSFWDEDFKKATRILTQKLDTFNTLGIILKLSTPQLFYFQIPGSNQFAFISPKDSLKALIVNDSCTRSGNTLKFMGENEVYYNYYRDLKLHLYDYTEPHFSRLKDMNNFKNAVKDWISVQKDYFKKFQEVHQLSKDFIKTETMRINCEYIRLLCSPVYNKYIKLDLLPKFYFDEIRNISFNDTDLLPIYYRAMFWEYVICSTNDVCSNLKFIYHKIVNDKKMNRFNKEYLITALIGYVAYTDKTFNKSELNEIILEAEKTITNNEFILNIKKSKEYFNYINQPFPDFVLDQTLLKQFNSNNKISLRELLNKHQGYQIYIDFWASWCGACRENLKNSKEAKYLFGNKEVKLIYLSLDDNDNNWVKAATDDNIIENQYRIIGGMNSTLVKYIKINSIPRYIFIDKNHKIKTLNAPKPIPVFISDLKQMIEDANRKAIVYF